LCRFVSKGEALVAIEEYQAGSLIETPNFDRPAADGLRFTTMHTTVL
jgi:arylsulfatase A-like enzyme